MNEKSEFHEKPCDLASCLWLNRRQEVINNKMEGNGKDRLRKVRKNLEWKEEKKQEKNEFKEEKSKEYK